jgi:hypothetical protein
MHTHTVVGVDPTRARALADGLRRAERALDDAAAAIADDLASCEVTAEGPGAIGAAAAWCGASALDLLHRIDGVSAGDRLVALLDEEAVPAWLADEHPDLAARRRSALDAIAGLDRERATLAASAYMGVSPSAGRQLRRRIRAIDVARSEARAQAEATDDDVEGDVAGLDDAEVEAAARAVGRTFSAVTDEGRRLALAGAVQPLRDRLLAELGAAGRALYVGGPDHGDVDRITHLLDAIAFRPIPPHESKAIAFLDGLVLGDAHPHRYRSPQAAWARTGGHLVSGLFRVGLVRDGLANLVRGHLEEAGADALGLLPLFGDIAKDGKELSTTARAARDLDRGLATAEHEAAAAERVKGARP